MAIGTDVKIGWDATAVKSGFASLKGMFGGVFRGMRQVGIGAARQMGAAMTDTLGRILMAVPEGLKEMMDWSGNLVDMSTQTGLAVSKIVVLEEALRMSGAAANDTSRILSTLKRNLYEASQEAGPARDALNKLGFRGSTFKDMDLDKAFEKIGHAIANFTGPAGELESIMADLFGARMGYKLIRFFKDFQGNMKQAQNNVGRFASRLDASAGSYDKLADALDRYKMRWRELMAIVVDQVTNIWGDDFVDKAFDFMNPEKIRNTINFLREEISGFFKSGGFTELFKNLGRQIAEGMKETLGEMLPTPSNFIRDMFSGGKKDDSTAALQSIKSATELSARTLGKIERNGLTSTWA